MPISDHPNYINIETLWNALITKIEQLQASYVLGNESRMYFQGANLLGDAKPDGVTPVLMQATAKVYDQEDSWNTFDSVTFKNNLTSLFNVRIDTHLHPEGRGYTITGEFWYAGLDPAGDHILKHHYVGPSPSPVTIYDEWYVMPEPGDI